MSLPGFTLEIASSRQGRSTFRSIFGGGAALAFLLLAACGGGTPSGTTGGATGTLSGTVRASGSSAALANATVSVGSRTATSDANGQFELTDLPAGAATVQVKRTGYLPTEALLTIAEGANSHDFTMSPQEVYELGGTAVFVPADVGTIRGTIIALGGPYTNGLVTGGRIETVLSATQAEALLQALGGSLRGLARSMHMALLGNEATLADAASSDNALLASIGTVAQQSGHAELTDAPLLMLGLSTGSPEAAGLASRHPDRTVGVLVWLPPSLTDLTATTALAVPAFVMQAQYDDAASNTVVRATFQGNRSRGGLWALAVEPDVGHTPTEDGNATVVNWIQAVLALRLPAVQGQPLVALNQTSGWLGNQATHQIAAWADYQGDRTQASWLLSEAVASTWRHHFGGELPSGNARN